MTSAMQSKETVRARVWSRLERSGAAGPGCTGHIPDFRGADEAARRLAALPSWQQAHVVKAVPDRAQFPVRLQALRDAKVLYMAVPGMAAPEPFCVLDPQRLDGGLDEAADGRTAARLAAPVAVSAMRPVDLIVTGSVAVDRRGARLGKGAGYFDLECALLAEAGLISPRTVVATTVHDLQIADGDLPEEDHDCRVDLIVTPSQVIACEGPPRRPSGIDWRRLDPARIAAIPALASRAAR